jgi:mRNA-degrading endonuclease RelE of RelBE toxin-antitoxin system
VAYLVKITVRAERDLADLYEKIDAGNSATAHRWYEGLKQAMLDLEENPYTWPATHEAERQRHILYGRKPHSIYRVIYRISERRKIVVVQHVRHGARMPFRPSDLK